LEADYTPIPYCYSYTRDSYFIMPDLQCAELCYDAVSRLYYIPCEISNLDESRFYLFCKDPKGQGDSYYNLQDLGVIFYFE
jgi:hypothetical protein